MRTVCYRPGPLQQADISDFVDIIKGHDAAQRDDDKPIASSAAAAQVNGDAKQHYEDNSIIASAPAIGVTA